MPYLIMIDTIYIGKIDTKFMYFDTKRAANNQYNSDDFPFPDNAINVIVTLQKKKWFSSGYKALKWRMAHERAIVDYKGWLAGERR